MTPFLRLNVIKLTFWLLLIANIIIIGNSNDILKFNNKTATTTSTSTSSSTFLSQPLPFSLSSLPSASFLEGTRITLLPNPEIQKKIVALDTKKSSKIILDKDEPNFYKQHSYSKTTLNNLNKHQQPHILDNKNDDDDIDYYNNDLKQGYYDYYKYNHNNNDNNNNKNDNHKLIQQKLKLKQNKQMLQEQQQEKPLNNKNKKYLTEIGQQKQLNIVSTNLKSTATNLNNAGEKYSTLFLNQPPSSVSVLLSTESKISDKAQLLPSSKTSDNTKTSTLSLTSKKILPLSEESELIAALGTTETLSSKVASDAVSVIPVGVLPTTSSFLLALSIPLEDSKVKNKELKNAAKNNVEVANNDDDKKNLKFSFIQGRSYSNTHHRTHRCRRHTHSRRLKKLTEPQLDNSNEKSLLSSSISSRPLEMKNSQENFNYHRIYNDPQQSHITTINHRHHQHATKKQQKTSKKPNIIQDFDFNIYEGLEMNSTKSIFPVISTKSNEENLNPPSSSNNDELISYKNFYKKNYQHNKNQRTDELESHPYQKLKTKKRHRHQKRHQNKNLNKISKKHQETFIINESLYNLEDKEKIYQNNLLNSKPSSHHSKHHQNHHQYHTGNNHYLQIHSQHNYHHRKQHKKHQSHQYKNENTKYNHHYQQQKYDSFNTQQNYYEDRIANIAKNYKKKDEEQQFQYYNQYNINNKKSNHHHPTSEEFIDNDDIEDETNNDNYNIDNKFKYYHNSNHGDIDGAVIKQNIEISSNGTAAFDKNTENYYRIYKNVLQQSTIDNFQNPVMLNTEWSNEKTTSKPSLPSFDNSYFEYMNDYNSDINNNDHNDYNENDDAAILNSNYFATQSASTISTTTEKQRIKNMVFRSLPETLEYHELYNLHWPVKREAIVEGDLILGGLMMVHSREDTITCGRIMPQGGIQALEAMLYTIDRINKEKLLPNIRLGAHILDDCDKDSYGLEMAVDFIKGSISNIDDAEYHCNKTQVRKVISGVVGAASSVTSIQVANLLRLFRIPQVSFFSTSPELSNKQRFEYFSRTIPSDHYQVKAMVEIVKRMSWSYISIIYEESNYGIKAYEELEELLAENSICIAVKEKLVKDSGVAGEKAYDNIVQKLLTKPRARGAIIFGSDQEVREVMRAVRRNNATGAFSWIGSDGWSARNLVSDGNEPEVEGTLSVQPQANPVKGFEAYFLNLTVENNLRNPWFVEFWEDHFLCRYPNSLPTPYNINYNRTCTTKEVLAKNNTDFEDQLQFVSDAVMAFAYALRDMHHDLCGGKPTLCESMKPTKGADLLKYLRKVQFEGLSGDHFRFDINGDGPARYNIIHFKQVESNKYRWVKVGEYYEGELRLNMTEVQFKLSDPSPPDSVCSLPCERGQAKKYVEGESCCWHCFNCSMYQIRHPIDETQCVTCDKGTLPDRMKERCQDIPEVYLRPESAWAIGAMAFSSTGILITLFVVGVFVKHNDTPVVRASGRELSYILLAGILMCYMVTFALVLRPTNIVCGLQRFGAGFCFTVVYAALLTKTNRIARIFKAGKQSAKRPQFISPKSQLVICACLTFIQILINGVWMVISPSHAIHHYPTREDNLLVCDSYIDASYMIAFSYPIFLIVVCTVYAVLTRKIPEAFNESKHIGFTMYTTCVIWLAFVPLYFGTGNHVSLRITSMSVTISLSASVTVACLFSPKLYIILVHPERNVRQSMMPARFSNINRGTGTGPSSMMAAAMVTAATCNQEEKIHKHISPSNTETNGKLKFCEIATQTVNISSIFTNIDSTALQQFNVNIPYADQNVPNNLENSCQNVSNNNKINNTTKISSPPQSTKIDDIYQQNRRITNLNTTTTSTTGTELKNNIIDTSL